MNAERLLAHYERIADAPDAIARLRSFVLDLAVRGKLVPQDPNDKPASELLKRIAKEKARREKTGTLREQKPLPQISAEDIDFELSRGWQWVRLGDVIKLWNGFAFKSGDFRSEGVPVIRIGDLQGGVVELSNAVCVSNAIAKTVGPEVWIPPDALLIAMSGATTGKTAFNRAGKPLLLNQRVGRIEVFSGNVDYIRCFFETIVTRNLSISFGTAIPNLSAVQINETVIALPPLAEQHRIVAKVDELMARDRLAASTLARLNTPDPATFQADARFALNTIPALTTRPDQIKQLRQTILNLAVRGKLVPQDPKDEPINVLLSKAMARRAALVRTKTVRLKKLDGYDSLVIDSELPASWKLERLGNLVDPENTISYGVLVPGDEVPDGIPFVRAQDLALSGHPERPNKTISPEIEKAYARTRLHGGEILVCVVGSIGKLGIAPLSWAGANIARAVARILPIAEISREYLLVVLRGEPVQMYLTEATRTLAQPTLNIGLIEQTPIPLPPLAEQHRIVAKVHALMKICDQLETSLDHTATTRRHLLDALLAEALTPVQSLELEAAE
jgi:type I restriction enzyme S subunit